MDELKRLVATLDDNMQDNTVAVKELRESQKQLAVGHQQMRRAQYRGRGVVIILALVVVAVVIVVVKTSSLGNCVNDNLGSRNGVTAKADLSDAAFADLVAVGVTKIPPTAEQANAINAAWGLGIKPGVLPTQTQFLAGLKAHAATLDTVHAYRVAHPLGRC